LTRRRLIKAGLAAALVLGGSAVAFVRTRGYVLPPGRTLVALSPWQFIVVQHAARRILAPDHPEDASIPGADDLDVAGFVDRWAARLQAPTRRDLGRFLAYLEHLAPVGLGLGSRFTLLPADQQDRVLASIEASSSDRTRGGFEGLKSLVLLGYYRDVRTWGIVGYDGPFVNRPTGGWR
jgi:hypothetical protein